MEAEQQIPPDPKTEEEMIDLMRAYLSAKDDLETLEARGKALVEKVKAEVEQDIAPTRERLMRLAVSMNKYLFMGTKEGKFRVPGLGTAYLRHRDHVELEEEEEVKAYLRNSDPDLFKEVVQVEEKLDKAAAKTYVLEKYMEGEVVPGTQVEKRVGVVVKRS